MSASCLRVHEANESAGLRIEGEHGGPVFALIPGFESIRRGESSLQRTSSVLDCPQTRLILEL